MIGEEVTIVKEEVEMKKRRKIIAMTFVRNVPREATMLKIAEVHHPPKSNQVTKIRERKKEVVIRHIE